MRASVIRAFNRPWVIEERARPEPGDGQVLLRVRASGMCGTDLHVSHGFMKVTPPIVAGHEAVGEVVACGAGVTLAIGDRVGVAWVQRGCGHCRWCAEGRAIHCREVVTWMDVGGGHAEYMLAYADACTVLPVALSYEAAAPMFCAGYTVVSALRAADARPGERCAVLGLGGLGHLAIQFAKAFGLEVVALTSSDDKADDARRFGADDAVVIDSHAGRKLDKRGGADVIVSTTNSARQLAEVITGLRPRGRLVNCGVPDGPLMLDATELMSIQGRFISVLQDRHEDLLEALTLTAAGRVKPAIETYPLEAHNDVLDKLRAGTVRYRAVLVP